MTIKKQVSSDVLSYVEIVEFIRDKWGILGIDEISKRVEIERYDILEIIMKENIQSKAKSNGLRFWEKYEIDFITKHSEELTTGKAAKILNRSRYGVYMKAKSLGLNGMIKGK